MDIILISALCIAACIISKLLEKESREFSFAVTAGVCVLAAVLIISDIADVTDTVSSLMRKIDLDEEYSKILFKSIGVCFLGTLASDLCRDCGESAMSSNVKMFSRVTILILALPLYSSVISLIDEMLG